MEQTIIQKVQKYNTSYSTFCFQNCIKYILEFYDVDNAEFYINKSLSLYMDKRERYNVDFMYEKSARSVLPIFSNKVKRYYPKGSCELDIFKQNISVVKSGKPIIVGVDSYYLSYLPFYMKSHGRHTIILADYDEVNDKVTVVDWMQPWFFKGTISRKEFIEARNSLNPFDEGIFSGSPIMNNWAEVEKSQWNWTVDELIKYTIELSLKQFYFPICDDTDLVKGLDVLKFISDAILWVELELSAEEQQKYLRKLHGNLYKLNCRRIFWKDFLLQLYDTNKNQEINEMIENTSLVIDKWEKWLYRVIKNSLRMKQGYSKDLVEKMNEIIELEMEGGYMLKNFYKKIIRRK